MEAHRLAIVKPSDLPPHLPGRLVRTDTAEYQLVAMDDGDPPNGLYRRIGYPSLMVRLLLVRADGTEADWEGSYGPGRAPCGSGRSPSERRL